MTHPCTPEPCVGSVLFWERKLLLIQRGQDPGAGKWSLPGGRLEPQETWQEAVERETEEETCLKVRCGKFIGWVDREVNGRRYLIADFLATTEDTSGAAPNDDARDLLFVGPEEIDKLELTDGLQEFLHQHQILKR